MAAKLYTIDPIWRDQDCIIIGGGPSIKNIPNLQEIIKDQNSIGCNDAYLFNTTICLSGDTRWYKHHGQLEEFKNYKGLKLSCSSDAKKFDDQMYYVKNKSSGLSEDNDKLAFNGNTGAAAINLALLLGATNIFLLGFDMTLDSNGESNWHPNIAEVPQRKYTYYKNKIQILSELINQKYPDVKIYNCNPESKLESFPKMTFDFFLQYLQSKDISNKNNEVVVIDDNAELLPHETVPNSTAIPVILTVLKGGGEYTGMHVKALKRQLDHNISVPYKFICYTDLNHIDNIETIKLKYNYPGWHSKFEVFDYDIKPDECVTYLDLDTIITGNIDDIVIHKNSFAGLQDFYHLERFASGILQWNTKPTFIKKIIPTINKLVNSLNWKNIWDQRLIEKEIRQNRIPWVKLQSKYPNKILSYKVDILKKSIKIENSKIICFHGTPRPWDVEQFKYLYEGL